MASETTPPDWISHLTRSKGVNEALLTCYPLAHNLDCKDLKHPRKLGQLPKNWITLWRKESSW